MPRFHAAFSGGTVVSALIGSAMSWAGIPLTCTSSGGPGDGCLRVWALPRFLPRSAEHHEAEVAARERTVRVARARTLLIGVVVFAAAFTEGTANDWLAVAFVEGHDLPAWAGVLAFAPDLHDPRPGRRHQPARPLRPGARPRVHARRGGRRHGHLRHAMARLRRCRGGASAALGFPVGMSAWPTTRRAAARMSVVATIGYVAFIAGPPVLGLLGDRVGSARSSSACWPCWPWPSSPPCASPAVRRHPSG